MLQKRVRPLPLAGTAPFFMSTKAFDRLNERKSKVATYNLDMKLVSIWLCPEVYLKAQEGQFPDRFRACVKHVYAPAHVQMLGCSCLKLSC